MPTVEVTTRTSKSTIFVLAVVVPPSVMAATLTITGLVVVITIIASCKCGFHCI